MSIKNTTLFDSHCHLQDERIHGKIDVILARAAGVGVCRMLCCGTGVDDWGDVARIGAAYSGVICAYGVHPRHVDQINDGWAAELEGHLHRDPLALVGEIGLDNAVDPRNDDRQIEIFTYQLEVAERYGRAVSIHCRRAFGNLLDILRRRGGLRLGGVIHSYSGAPNVVRELESLGCYFSFSGSILYAGNKRAIESLRRISPDRLLIETDSPDILPAGVSGPHNEPMNLVLILNGVAEILDKTPEEIAELTYNNGARFLRLQNQNKIFGHL